MGGKIGLDFSTSGVATYSPIANAPSESQTRCSMGAFQPIAGTCEKDIKGGKTDALSDLELAEAIEVDVEKRYSRLCNFSRPSSSCLKHPSHYIIYPIHYFRRNIFHGRGDFALPGN